MDETMTPAVSNPMTDIVESHELALLAARAFAASRRPASGAPLDETDKAALLSVAVLLESSEPLVEYFSSYGVSGQAPSEAVASRLDVTVDAVIGSKRAGASIQDALTSIALAIREFVDAPLAEVADQLSQFFTLLGHAAARRTAAPGETAIAV